MPDRIQVNEELGIIEVNSFGEICKKDLANTIAQLKILSREKEITKVFVDTTAQERMPSTIDMLSIFPGFPKNLKIAVLVHQSQPTLEDNFFIETLAVNRGYNFSIFESRQSALDWLNS